MRYLIDANVWLDAVTNGPRWQETVDMLQLAAPGSFATTDFTVHTIGIVLAPRSPNYLMTFLDDLVRHHVFTLHLAPSDLREVVDRMRTTGLDFDDAFQLVSALRNNLRIVSFDADFDRVPGGRMTPAQVVAELRAGANP